MNLAHYVPNLRNLSLQGNKVRTWRDLEYLGGKGKKLSALRELIFMDNPLRDQEMKAGRHEQYKRSVAVHLARYIELTMARIQRYGQALPKH